MTAYLTERTTNGVGRTLDPEGGGWEFQLLMAGDLLVLNYLQCERSEGHIRKRAREWDESLVTPLVVSRLTDGAHVGRLHVCDGGTRVKRWTASYIPDRDPSHIFVCVVRPTTEREAARIFLALNKLNKRPGAVDNYRVGLAAGNVEALAVHRALEALGLDVATRAVYGDASHMGSVAAVQAMERIVTSAHAFYGDWATASDLLAWVLTTARRIYTDGAAHDADLIQALAHLAMVNGTLVQSIQQQDRIVMVIGSASVEQWRLKAQAQRATEQVAAMGGSASRSRHFATAVVNSYNRGRGASARLRDR